MNASRKAVFAGVILLGVLISLGSLLAQAAGPWMGTWKLNLTKSKYNPGPGPAPGTVTIFKMMPEKDGFKYTLDTTLPDGNRTHAEAFARFDGKEYPETGNPAADFNVFQRVDDHTYSLTDRKDGKDALHFRIGISGDGKTRTSVASGKTKDGRPVDNVGVWDRQ
jgi:hypothetical protein